MTIEFVIFGIALILELLLGVGLITSLLFPKHRIWPPSTKGSWQYWYMHFLTESSIFCFFILGFLDWNTFFITHWIRFLFSFILIVPGLLIFLWGIQTLKLKTSLGLKEKMITKGPYKYSRNPQYVGIILFFSGLILFFNSFYAIIIGFIGNIWFLFTPFVEEAWLREQYKEEYDDYFKKVSRFI